MLASPQPIQTRGYHTLGSQWCGFSLALSGEAISVETALLRQIFFLVCTLPIWLDLFLPYSM